jgi:hypothetical protein
MKVFAFLLAFIFTAQATTPALCMTNCALEFIAASTSCASAEQEPCSSEQMTSCTLNEAAAEKQNTIPCEDCCIPCCSAPLCCFYFQELTTLDLTLNPVLSAGTLPSNNGIPHSGYHTECFQPPESIS